MVREIRNVYITWTYMEVKTTVFHVVDLMINVGRNRNHVTQTGVNNNNQRQSSKSTPGGISGGEKPEKDEERGDNFKFLRRLPNVCLFDYPSGKIDVIHHDSPPAWNRNPLMIILWWSKLRNLQEVHAGRKEELMPKRKYPDRLDWDICVIDSPQTF